MSEQNGDVYEILKQQSKAINELTEMVAKHEAQIENQEKLILRIIDILKRMNG